MVIRWDLEYMAIYWNHEISRKSVDMCLYLSLSLSVYFLVVNTNSLNKKESQKDPSQGKKMSQAKAFPFSREDWMGNK